MSVDIDGDAIDYQPVDSWLARVGGLPSREVSAPRPPAVRILLPSLFSPFLLTFIN